ncbi:MAG: hypothetical protein LBE75_00470 [Burkholderiales bacterium]|nr:hypothetical protein [Burkholderiales bacterium]
MIKLLRATSVAILAHTSLAIAGSGWVLDEKIDPLTDERVATATSSYAVGLAKRSAIVRCKGTKLEVYFGFGEFLNNDLVPVRYRLDKELLVDEKWFPSAEGTAVFAREDTDIARLFMKGTTFIIEAEDFRGQPHRASFDLSGARKILSRVLQQCSLSEAGLDQKVKGLRREIALDLERWGPKNIATNKNILRALGAYDGPQDTTIDAAFALSVQRFYDDYLLQCKENKLSGRNCNSLHIFWKSEMKPVTPPISAVIYERAPSDLKKEAGKLRVGE